MKTNHLVAIYCFSMVCLISVIIADKTLSLPLVFLIIAGTGGFFYLVRKNKKEGE